MPVATTVSTEVMLALAALACLGWPVLAYLWARGRAPLAWRDIALGAAIFVLFVFVLERTTLIALAGWLPELVPGWTRAGVLLGLGALAAGLFEECGRYVALRWLATKPAGLGTGLAYGIGHGGIEALLLGAAGNLNALLLLRRAVDLSGPDSPAVAAHLAALPGLDILLGVFERGAALALQLALSLVVLRAVRDRRPLWLLAAILLHALADTAPSLHQAGLLSLYATEAFVLLAATLALGFLWWRAGRADNQ
jgi:uncharacterized membrane protein YhfC